MENRKIIDLVTVTIFVIIITGLVLIWQFYAALDDLPQGNKKNEVFLLEKVKYEKVTKEPTSASLVLPQDPFRK